MVETLLRRPDEQTVIPDNANYPDPKRGSGVLLPRILISRKDRQHLVNDPPAWGFAPAPESPHD